MALIVSILLLALASLAQQPTRPMTDQDVIDMVSLGLSDDVVIDKIKANNANDFDTSLAGLKALKLGKVSDAVIRVMIHVMINPPENTAPAGIAATSSPGAASPTEEAGVYAVLGGKPVEIEPEVVNWQTGGVAKSRATLFIVKGDLNGKVMNPASPTQLKSPLEFLIRTVEGTSATEYQLLRLHQKSDRREFRSVTGGVLHQSGGAQRDEVSFQPEKTGTRLWKVRLDSLPSGEYGFLAPGTSSVSISASGKMYTFGVIEGDLQPTQRDMSSGDHKTEAPAGLDAAVSNPEFSDATIGVSTDESPKIRHDGITLSRVTPGGPAEQAGIRVGDVIFAIDNRYLFTAEELEAEIKRHKPGTRVAIRYRRYSTIYSTNLTVGSMR
jgi:hypothetical protein